MRQHCVVRGNAKHLPIADKSVHCCVTSPPYWGLRDYDVAGQLGNERTPDEYVANMVDVFREVKRVLRDDGTLWLNLGDSYNGYYGNQRATGLSIANQHARISLEKGHGIRCNTLKPKDLVGIPWRVAFALQADGWYLRSEITWCKTSPMPESVNDRPTSATEKVFLLTKSLRYFYDAEAIRVPSAAATIERDKSTRITKGKDGPYAVQHDHETPSNPSGRNIWNYWVLGSQSFKGAHFATYPRMLVEPCIKAGTSEAGCCAMCGCCWERVTDFTSTTIGWRPGCECGGPVVPCVVLDPFSGAATTGVVATALSRKYLGVELSQQYILMSRRRLDRPHAPVEKQRASETFPLFP